MKKINANTKGQSSHTFFQDNCLKLIALLSRLSYCTILLFLQTSCVQEIPGQESHTLEIKSKSETGETIIDIFIYNDDQLKILDSYNRFALNQTKYNIDASSRTGDKIVVIIENPQLNDYIWSDIRSYDGLKKMKMSLLEESNAKRTRISSFKISAGGFKQYYTTPEPIYSEILIRSINCDFSSKTYENSRLSNVRFYLTNINTECELLNFTNFNPSYIINMNGLDPQNINQMEELGMYLEYNREIGKEAIHPMLKLLTYPSNHEEESIGAPFTRLVIQGDIDGHTYYYPININRPPFCNGRDYGIGRNCQYIFDITIKRTGLKDDKNAIDKEYANIKNSIIEWEIEDEIIVNY